MPEITQGEEHLSIAPPDSTKENVKSEKPTLTVYVLRHGETEKDKTKKDRGLTEKGRKEILDAADKIISELNPQTDIIQLLDSDTPRTKTCNELIGQKLKEAGFKFFNLIKRDKSGKLLQDEVNTSEIIIESKKSPTVKMPKTSKTDSEAQRDPERKKRYNIPEDIKDARLAIWYAMGERDELTESETPKEVAERMEHGIEQAKREIPMLQKLLKPGQRIVTIINANAPPIDVLITKKTSKSVLERGGVKNAQGFKIDFSSSNNADDTIETTFEEWPTTSH